MTSLRYKHAWIIVLLGLLSVVTPFAIDMYLPAFSRIAADFGTTTSLISISLSTYFIGFALGQILYGPLLDRFGRKRPLYFGLIVYIIASIGLAQAHSIHAFIALRFIQALGGCAAQVAAIAMVRDFFHARESARVFSLLFLIIGTSPLLAPTIGSLLVSSLGWRWIFLLLAANALMLHKRGDVIAPDYITLLKTRYAAEVFQQATLDDVNSWVARKTADMIPHMLDQLDPDASATLIDAVYFKARWASVFDKKLTKDEPFHLDRAQQADVAMMNQSGNFSLVSRGGYRALRLDYELGDLGLVIVLPDDVEGAAAVGRRLDANTLTELFTALRDGKARKPVALTLPRFKSEYKVDLVEPFRQMGMRKAFEPAAADFAGMTGRPAGQGGVYLGTVLHRAVIDVAEESTEAAAATAVVIRPTAMAPPAAQPEPFRVDHPFLFYLVDDTTGLILFQGRISDPR